MPHDSAPSAAARATAVVSEPPRPSVVMSKSVETPWKPATRTIFSWSSASWIRRARTSTILALPWTVSVTIPAWLPVSEIASWPRSWIAIAAGAPVTSGSVSCSVAAMARILGTRFAAAPGPRCTTTRVDYRRFVPPLFAVGAIALLPWTVWLGSTLPSHHVSEHWRVAWVGLDVALIAGLLAVAYHAWRKTIWLEALAAATGTLLLCDAWFDVLLEPGAHFWIAVVEAVAIEIPAAVLCFWIAR